MRMSGADHHKGADAAGSDGRPSGSATALGVERTLGREPVEPSTTRDEASLGASCRCPDVKRIDSATALTVAATEPGVSR